MSIWVNIKNQDKRDGAVISVKIFDGTGQQGQTVELNAQEEVEKLVHGLNKIIIEEVRQPG
jgi:hypothetical protein